jgi:hypothetical protein
MLECCIFDSILPSVFWRDYRDNVWRCCGESSHGALSSVAASGVAPPSGQSRPSKGFHEDVLQLARRIVACRFAKALAVAASPYCFRRSCVVFLPRLGLPQLDRCSVPGSVACLLTSRPCYSVLNPPFINLPSHWKFKSPYPR